MNMVIKLITALVLVPTGSATPSLRSGFRASQGIPSGHARR
jgi:hypothetical protein